MLYKGTANYIVLLWLCILTSLVGESVGVVAISCLIIILVRIHTRGLLITPSVCTLYLTEPTSAQNHIYDIIVGVVRMDAAQLWQGEQVVPEYLAC